LITLSYFDKKRLPTNLVKLLDEFKFDRNNFVNKIFQQPLPPVRFKDKLLTITKDSDRFHLAYHCCALKLEKDDSGKIVSLLFGQPDGSTHELKAGLFVIGIGALESPRLLLNSGFDNPNIGRFLMDHPMGNLCQIGYKEKRTAHIYSGTMISSGCVIKSGLEFSFSMQREEKLPNHCFYPRVSFSKGIDNKTENVKLSLLTFRDGGVSFKDILNLILNINLVIQILIFKFSLNFKHKYSDLFFVSEQIPNPDSTVTLSKDMKDRFGFPIAEVNWQLTDQDWKSMEETYSLLKNQCFETDFCDFTHESKDLDWKGNMSSAAHHVGTLRMAETAQDGVVDKNLKVFGAENLYVCDGSVFTTSGNVNSSFTIGALACRLAKHLAGNQPAGTND